MKIKKKTSTKICSRQSDQFQIELQNEVRKICNNKANKGKRKRERRTKM